MSMNAALPGTVVVAVVGAGAMGAGIAQVAAAAGHTVKLVDTRALASQTAVTSIRAQFAKLAEKGKLTSDAALAASERLIAAKTLSDLADAGLVVEAIAENLQAKQQLFRDLEGIVSPGCYFATNTSSISVPPLDRHFKIRSAWPECTFLIRHHSWHWSKLCPVWQQLQRWPRPCLTRHPHGERLRCIPDQPPASS